jgi:hypothetical protein
LIDEVSLTVKDLPANQSEMRLSEKGKPRFSVIVL